MEENVKVGEVNVGKILSMGGEGLWTSRRIGVAVSLSKVEL
jgi:hypothetical protein